MDLEARMVYQSLVTLRPKQKTSRIKDFSRLSKLEKSFLLVSPRRNGTTTLFKELVRSKDGIYFDGHDSDHTPERILATPQNLILIDEFNAFAEYRFGELSQVFDYIKRLSQNKQVGLRVHLDMEDVFSSGLPDFDLVRLGKISYEELVSIVNKDLRAKGYEIPERVICEAHEIYEALCYQVRYIGTAFKMISEGNIDPTPIQIMKFSERRLVISSHEEAVEARLRYQAQMSE